MENKQQLIFLFVMAIFCCLILYFFWPNLSRELTKKEVILVKIQLENRCSFSEDVFIVLHEDTGRAVNFNNGIANINVLEGSDLVLALSPLYPDFRYDGIPQPAKPQMNMIADCSTSPRMQMIMDSMKESFKN